MTYQTCNELVDVSICQKWLVILHKWFHMKKMLIHRFEFLKSQ